MRSIEITDEVALHHLERVDDADYDVAQFAPRSVGRRVACAAVAKVFANYRLVVLKAGEVEDEVELGTDVAQNGETESADTTENDISLSAIGTVEEQSPPPALEPPPPAPVVELPPAGSKHGDMGAGSPKSGVTDAPGSPKSTSVLGRSPSSGALAEEPVPPLISQASVSDVLFRRGAAAAPPPEIYKPIIVGNYVKGVIPEVAARRIGAILSSVPAPVQPGFPPDLLLQPIVTQMSGANLELHSFFLQQWGGIESCYAQSLGKAFELLTRGRQAIADHLWKARAEFEAYLVRPGTSQQCVTEFQNWHCGQVERCMRRMQKVKDECSVRLQCLRESLLQIEAERKVEEEAVLARLASPAFRAAIQEVLSNAWTLVAQTELDRWTATRALLLNFNQVLADQELVPPLPRRKLQLAETAKGQKRQVKPKPKAPPPKTRTDSKQTLFDSPLMEQLDGAKKYVLDAGMIYARVPTSTRGKKPVKDKNPFAVHKVTALDDFLSAFVEDDALVVERLDAIGDLVRVELGTTVSAFEAFQEAAARTCREHCDRRRAVADTAVAWLLQLVADEKQINQLVVLSDDRCVVDGSRLVVPNEEEVEVPVAFPDAIKDASLSLPAEKLFATVFASTADEEDG